VKERTSELLNVSNIITATVRLWSIINQNVYMTPDAAYVMEPYWRPPSSQPPPGRQETRTTLVQPLDLKRRAAIDEMFQRFLQASYKSTECVHGARCSICHGAILETTTVAATSRSAGDQNYSGSAAGPKEAGPLLTRVFLHEETTLTFIHYLLHLTVPVSR